jgi:truncated hemoglobin YjbI
MEDPPYPAPDPELWQALQNGELLLKILKDFYTQVYHDEKLNGFFKDVTKQRAIEKQYNFLRRVFTGEKVYFGEKPRNAHHWMVISNELFDYREALIEASMRKFGLPDNMISRWLDLHEIYRKVIVKPEAWKKIFAGEELPLDGYEALQLDIGSVCDGCSNVLEPGDNVTYHVRLGTIYCTECRQHNS